MKLHGALLLAGAVAQALAGPPPKGDHGNNGKKPIVKSQPLQAGIKTKEYVDKSQLFLVES